MLSSPTTAELRHLCWKQLGVRVNHTVSRKDLMSLLALKTLTTPHNPVNIMRDKIMAYIRANKNRLSLPCDGICYNHTDGVVLACWDLFSKEVERGQSA